MQQLVWSGEKELPQGFQAFDAQVINYNDKPHFAFTSFQGVRGGGTGSHGSGTFIYDDTYTKVQEVTTSGTWRNQSLTPDLHEFNIVDNGASALMTSYITIEENVTYPDCAGKTNFTTTRFTKTGLFSEVTTDGTNTELFQWAASDHIDPTDTYVCPGDRMVGNGQFANSSFDFFHINSADKDAFGDYIVSGRHVSTIYKIAGKNSPSGLAPGEIIWRLGGKHNTFSVMDSEVSDVPNLNFSMQHHARWNTDINGFTFWDNANNAINEPTSTASSGKAVRLDGDSSATLVKMFVSPERQLDSSQGSHQPLPNGNSLLGMGSYPYFYEVKEDGTPVYYARFGVLPIQSYRVFKFEWVGSPPVSEMALFSYSKYCNGSAALYASWNGATEVSQWRYYMSDTENGTFTLVATKDYDWTFETVAAAPFHLFAYAEAYDSAGNKMGQTPTVSTFVPHVDIVSNCSSIACSVGTNYTEALNKHEGCPAPSLSTLIWL